MYVGWDFLQFNLLRFLYITPDYASLQELVLQECKQKCVRLVPVGKKDTWHVADSFLCCPLPLQFHQGIFAYEYVYARENCIAKNKLILRTGYIPMLPMFLNKHSTGDYKKPLLRNHHNLKPS